MSAKSKKSAKAIDRPIDADTMAKANKIADRYQIIMVREEGHWYGRGLELPHVFGDGKTANQCIENTKEALAGAVAYLLEEGRRPPTPASTGARTAQVNIRLTAEERALLETTSRRKGFSGLSDFVRAAAMELSK
ncbi:MAG: type II toxin-antitoxin system HicB family antitoxin [Planctomycetes bacterium]|nr:type II toxin-antitoxin system HicB family antitoxin [Planctomycetota bacterium]MCG2682717.1 type II toxin-antitoxin system HicB family antitoxin [Planctomycetales bacterium]